MKPLTFILLSLLSGVALAQYEPLTTDALQQRLRTSAQQYKDIGSIARMIHHDLAFPRDSKEYRAMNGFGLLWVSAHSQLSEELPLENMRIKTVSYGVIELQTYSWFSSIEQDDLIASVLGKYRVDSVYLVPLYEEILGGELLVDYSANRVDFGITWFELSLPEELGTLMAFKDHEPALPELSILNAMLDREFPVTRND